MQLEGQIRDIDVIARLVELYHEKFTGAFRFEQDGVIKIIYFKSGDVLSASTNDRTDSIDEILLRAGKVSREHIKQALAKRKESETLGDALLNLGFITRKELTWARRVQVIGILRSIGTWSEGTYTGVADYLPKREEGTLFPLPQIILELIVTDSDRSRFEQAMDGGSAIFAKTSDFDDMYRRLGLNEDADQIVAEIDGLKSASDIASASGKDAFNVYKLLEALRALGVVARIERTHGAPELSFDDFVPETGPVEVSTETAELPLSNEEFDWSSAPTWEPVAETPTAADVPLTVPAPAAVLPSREEGAASPAATERAPVPPLEKTLEPEPQWGFDEAQIETARRAAVPLRAATAPEPPPPSIVDDAPKASKPRRRLGVFVLLLVVIVLAAFGGFAGWTWWQKQQLASAPQVAVRGPVKRPLRPVPAAAPVIVHEAPVPAPGQVNAAPALGVPPTLTATTATVVTPTPNRPPVPAPVATNTANTTTATAAAATRRAGVPPAGPAASTPPPATATTAPAAPAQASRLERTTTGGAVITNSTAAPAAATSPADDSALRRRYDAMAHENAAIQQGTYTIQFELVCETASITKAVNAGRSSVWFVPISYRGKPCYRVFWGRYDKRDDALKAVAEIPAALRDSVPVVVKIPR